MAFFASSFSHHLMKADRPGQEIANKGPRDSNLLFSGRFPAIDLSAFDPRRLEKMTDTSAAHNPFRGCRKDAAVERWRCNAPLLYESAADAGEGERLSDGDRSSLFRHRSPFDLWRRVASCLAVVASGCAS